MIIPVYFDDRVLNLTDDLDVEVSKGFDAIHEYSSMHELKQFVQKFDANKNLKQGILFSGHPVEVLWKHFKMCFKYVEAAGGLIFTSDDKYLFIFRRGKWDLPKGKREKNETIEDTALREVLEECGIKCVINSLLTETCHTYTNKNKLYLKKTFWYRMYSEERVLKPQHEEDIEKAVWLRKTDLKSIKTNTYKSVLDVMDKIE